MIAAKGLYARARAAVRRIPSWIPLAVVVACVPAWFASASYERTVEQWMAREGGTERLGPYYAYLFKELGLIEKVAFLATDPSARFESTGISKTHDWRLVSGDRVLLRGNLHVSATLPRTRNSGRAWYDPDGTSDVYYAAHGVQRARSGIVVRSTDIHCSNIISALSPYAISRMRAAWISGASIHDAEYDPQWSEPGQAAKACDAGAAAKMDVSIDPFLMLFETPEADRTRTGALEAGGVR